MKTRDRIRNRLSRRVLILDGATGTELQARGMPPGVSPELYCAEHPDIIRSVHKGYMLAGADVVYTCTFGANRYKLASYGSADARELNRRLALIAREASGGRAMVAGDIGPTGRLVEPFGDLAFEDAVACFKEQVQGLAQGGVDLFVIETMMDIQEARAALIAVKETVGDAFTIVTMTYDSSGRTLTGSDCVSALVTLQSLGADAVGCNCSAGPAEMVPLVAAMSPLARVPIVAKPNAGLPRLKGGVTTFEMGAREFALAGRALIEAGASIIGGCCGTTPGHIEELRAAVKGMRPSSGGAPRALLLSSHARTAVLGEGSELAVIGERINPTGKKALQEELRRGVFSLVREYARSQVAKGAKVLDVNVGMPNVNEKELLREVVKQVVLACDAPLCIDSSNPEALGAALRVYPGRALVNSISGEQDTLDEKLRITSFYGAPFILLPVTGTSLPKRAAERLAVVRKVVARARDYGFGKDDILVDALTMAVSADAQAPAQTLETIRLARERLGLMSVVGLSNVSFGLPERKWVNAAFLAMASANGLSCAIANPESEEVMSVKHAVDVLRGSDRDAHAYIAKFGAVVPEKPQPRTHESPASLVARAILEGDRERIVELVGMALDKGEEPGRLVDEVMIPAIREVGRLYESKVYFLPQLIASAEAMKLAVERIEPLLDRGGASAATKGVVVLATVRGDIHDIGKNIVGLMLRNNGFTVEDLGKDVPAERIAEAAREKGAHIVGLSALMTTTMAGMEDTVRYLRNQGLRCAVMVGGAVVTGDFARAIGAAYAKDGVEAVRVAESIMASLVKGTEGVHGGSR
ncbi:MAG TPA: homocysteine S-methyltransferase family protein [Deltaproteobacteria bacterium]|nr:homocysteine S-methyltransferase family protein [Deltaproteobacteria bacterium]HPP79546.1 homocysteine S-methyltransferase family protein [Deltaproteobacteria bacterium]